MKLHELISARYGCRFTAKLNKPAIDYYLQNSPQARCHFIFDMMLERRDFTLCSDDIRYMCEEATEVFPEMLEAFLWAAYEDVKKNRVKPKNLVIILDERP